MTVYTKSLAGVASFSAGTNLYPGGDGSVSALTPDTVLWPDDLLAPGGVYNGLYPSPNQYPYGGSILVTVNHSLPGVFQPSGVATPNASSRARSFAGVFAPTVGFSKATSRSLTGAAASFAGSLARQQSTHVFAQALFASLRAAGAMSTVVNPGRVNPGGGGFATPMGEDFFQRYKPTLRRQKMRA